MHRSNSLGDIRQGVSIAGQMVMVLQMLLLRRLERLDGVAQVEIDGLRIPELQVNLDPARLQAHAVDVRQLVTLLRNNNVLMIRSPNDRFFISASANVRSTVPSFVSAPGPGYSNVIVPLQYISATEMAEILKPVARDDAFVRVDEGRNLLILAGTQLQLEGWLDIVTTFDVDQLAGKSVGIFPLANSTV